MKVNSKVYKGIEYIQLSDLPKNQQELFQQSCAEHFFIKILIDDKVVSKCIQYKDYERWFDHVYKREQQNVIAKENVNANRPAIRMAFGEH